MNLYQVMLDDRELTYLSDLLSNVWDDGFDEEDDPEAAQETVAGLQGKLVYPLEMQRATGHAPGGPHGS